MKQTKYTGVFKSAEGHIYELVVYCDCFLQAFFLLTADAINTGRHYQLSTITDDKNQKVSVDDIMNCINLLHTI